MKAKYCNAYNPPKRMYPDEKSANYGLRVAISHDPHVDMFNIHSYLCPSCGAWHIGHRKWFKQDNTVSS